MDWLKVKIKVDNIMKEAVSNLLIERGSNGIEEFSEDNKTVIIGYYSGSPFICDELSVGMNKIQEIFNSDNYEITSETVRTEDWANNWKKHYKPFYLAPDVMVKPSWEPLGESSDIIIEIDPGMAFGTGLHETTKLCAEFIKENIKKDDKIVDLGCGSGILSILAEKLGAKEIVAADIDSASVKTAKKNFEINGIKNKYKILEGTIDSIESFKADIFVCNIIADVLIDISDKIKNLLKEDSKLILSGIIKDRADDVLKSYTKQGYKLIEKKIMGEWVAYLFYA
jgi:ribosomal protein L11 methyltransferase